MRTPHRFNVSQIFAAKLEVASVHAMRAVQLWKSHPRRTMASSSTHSILLMANSLVKLKILWRVSPMRERLKHGALNQARNSRKSSHASFVATQQR
jgi:hypothetical protein